MTYKEEAFDQIDKADISPTLFRSAVRLLLRVSDDNGYLKDRQEAILDILHVNSWNSARSILMDLRNAGIITYSIGDDGVRVDFLAWPVRSEMDHQRSRLDHQRSNLDHDWLPCDEEVIQSGSRVIQIGSDDLEVIQNGSPARAIGSRVIQSRAPVDAPIGSRLVGSNHTLLDPQKDQEPTNLEPVQLTPPGPEEVERSFALLTDPELVDGVHQTKKHLALARKYACRHRFPWLVQQVAAYLRDLRTDRVRGIGALHKRIDATFRLEPFDDDFLASDFYRRHYPLDEEDIGRWERWQKYGGDEYADVMGLDPPDFPSEVEALVRQLPLPVESRGGVP